MIRAMIQDLEELNRLLKLGIKILWAVLLLTIFCIAFSFVSLIVMKNSIQHIVYDTLQQLPDTFDTSNIIDITHE